MFKAEIVNGKPVVLHYGEMVEKGFNYLAEAQERADELNAEITRSREDGKAIRSNCKNRR